jgi:hypothetical protein
MRCDDARARTLVAHSAYPRKPGAAFVLAVRSTRSKSGQQQREQRASIFQRSFIAPYYSCKRSA